ncbi:hypothetical protein EOM57_04840 [Candidatus Saccharibacteria bacterium]|nr:hypothetical protein [Candidatus Saccharibacteria bacterium]
MVIKYSKKKFFNVSKIILCVALLCVGIININKALATDVSIVKVNGTFIFDSSNPDYDASDGYNSSHGISGVSYNTDNKTLDLTSASIESIYANGDLTINVTNNNAVDAVTSNIAVEVSGNLTVIGSNDSSLNIAAMSADDRAIEIAPGAQLTVGNEADPTEVITVSIQRGRNVNTEHTSVFGDNTYNYTAPGAGGPGGGDPGHGGPMGPPPGAPIKIYVGGVLAIDETVEPKKVTGSGDNWSISQNDFGGWDVRVDTSTDTTIEAISGEGDGMITVCPSTSALTIESDPVSGNSLDFEGEMLIFTCEAAPGDPEMSTNLEGGIRTKSAVDITGDLKIGSVSNLSTKGIEALEVKVAGLNRELTIYTDDTALSYWDGDPAPGEGLKVIAENKGKILVAQSNNATDNTLSVLVQSGGEIDLNYTAAKGTFAPKAAHWAWSDLSGVNGVNKEAVVVDAVVGTDVDNKYVMSESLSHFNLNSTANAMGRIGYFLVGKDSTGISPRIPAENQIQNGFIEILAARGTRIGPMEPGGGIYWEDADAGIKYEGYDYNIEVGSEVTIKMLPDYGYQFVSGAINGVPLSGDADIKASYTFVMPAGGMDITAKFEKTDDIVAVNDPTIKSATLAMPANAINGNAELTIKNASDANTDGFKTAAGSLNVAKYLDLSLNEVIYKGATEDAWKTPITELNDEMTVNVELSDELQGYSDYTVLRDHEGTITKLDSTYDPETGMLSFQTDAYSDYAIAHGEAVTNPNTFDGIMKYFVIGLLSLLGLIMTIIYLFTKKIRLFRNK